MSGDLMLKSMLKFAQKTINSSAGNKYREIYLSRYPQDEHRCAGCKSVFLCRVFK